MERERKDNEKKAPWENTTKKVKLGEKGMWKKKIWQEYKENS